MGVLEDKEKHFDKVLLDHIDIMADDLDQDDDSLIVIFGDEGAGKSVLESQIAVKLKEKLKCEFSINKNVHYHGHKYINATYSSPKKSIQCMDESRRTLNKMRMMTGTHQEFMDFLAECRSDNQAHIIVLPSYYDIDKDVAIRRLKLLIRVVKRRDPVTKRLVKGVFQIINCKDKSKLKKLYSSESYEIPSDMIVYQGKFDYWWGWDEIEYKDKKEREKRSHRKSGGVVSLTNKEVSVVEKIQFYLSRNKLITDCFEDNGADMKAFERLRKKVLKSEIDRQTT